MCGANIINILAAQEFLAYVLVGVKFLLHLLTYSMEQSPS